MESGAGAGSGRARDQQKARYTGGFCSVDAGKILLRTQHNFCTAPGALLGASSNLGGRLVLSDFSCDVKKCDPKTQKCD